MAKIQRALVSVTDKTGLADFARALLSFGVEMISTGGTAKLLRDAGVRVKDVAEVTGFPEMLDGRVKTIHPGVAGGVLAVRSKPEHLHSLAAHGIPLIDMVVVNLYAFEKVAANPEATVEEMIEKIDIGGPTLIRAAAKNYQDVAVITSPADYAAITEELQAMGGQLSLETHWRLAKAAFARTAAYDRAITARLSRIDVEDGRFADHEVEVLPPLLDVFVPRTLSLRYGENPHQSAALYATGGGIAAARQLQGRALSYNNLVDLDAAWQLILEFDGPACAILKHTNPCGCAEQASPLMAYQMALEADPVSAFGGVLAFNRVVDEETAREVTKVFSECIAAPGYTDGALGVFAAKRNLRLLAVEQPSRDTLLIKSISGGILAQTPDRHQLSRTAVDVKTRRLPSEEEWRALEFAWKVVKHVKSNAIVYARAGQAIGAGAGQMSRVDSVKIGAMRATLPLRGCVVASDAFFPFPDGVEEAAKHGITAVIQPGGSVKDEEVVAVADRLGLAMVFTGVRHFRH